MQCSSPLARQYRRQHHWYYSRRNGFIAQTPSDDTNIRSIANCGDIRRKPVGWAVIRTVRNTLFALALRDFLTIDSHVAGRLDT
jgi:hypothetical protein